MLNHLQTHYLLISFLINTHIIYVQITWHSFPSGLLKILYKMKIIHLVHDSIVSEKLRTYNTRMWTTVYRMNINF